MKIFAKTMFASALSAVLLTSTAMTSLAANAKIESPSTDSLVTFNKILISGNVIVVIKQGTKERITVDEAYDRSRTTIKRKGYTLMISSSEYEPVTITVSVKDLQRIDAGDNAVIRTEGKIAVKYLQVFLKDAASAVVKANTESLYTYIKGNADLKLSGATGDHTVLKDRVSRLNIEGLAALKSTTDSIRTENIVALKGR
jgi:hypothetical protein